MRPLLLLMDPGLLRLLHSQISAMAFFLNEMFPKLNGRTDKRAKIKCTVSYKYIQSTKYSSIITICGVICPLLVIAVFLHMPLIGK